MPIKLCQNCGLKVFVEEGQPIAVPFLCARCQAAMRAAQHQHERAPTITMMNRPKPVSELPQPAPAPVPAADTGKTQLSCPGCSATFSVKLPDQPARGKCPKCFQSLLVYPDGIVVVAKSGSTGIHPPVTGASPSASRVNQPAVAASPGTARVNRPASAEATRAGTPAVRADASASSAGQAAVSATRIGRPTGNRPAPPPAEPAPAPEGGPEPVTMEGPESGSDAVPAQTPAPAEAVPDQAPAAAADATADAAPVADAEQKPSGRARPGTLSRRPFPGKPEGDAPSGDSSAKLYMTIAAVALPVILAVVLYFLRTNPGVIDLLVKAGAPAKAGLSKVTGPLAPVQAAPAKSPAKPAVAPKKEPVPAPADAPKSDAPKADAPKADEPKADAPKADAPAVPAPAAPKDAPAPEPNK
jgi:hypothetical protein